MLKHYLLIALRGIKNDLKYSVVNIFGLAVALSCCLLLVFWMKYELSYEGSQPNANRLYRVLEVENRTNSKHYNQFIRPGIALPLKEQFPQIKASTYFNRQNLSIKVDGAEGDGIQLEYVHVSPDFLKMFGYRYVGGSPQAIWDSEDVIITEEAARKLFGKRSPLGEKIVFGENFLAHTIGAVVYVPKNSHIQFDILVIDKKPSFASFGEHYIMLDKSHENTTEFEKQLSSFLPSIRDTKNTLTIQPIKDIHLHSPAELTKEGHYGSVSQMALYSLGAVLILVVAIVSYINTSVARSLNRLREVGVRKIYGSARRQLVARFLSEAFLISVAAIVLALVFVALFFPYFSSIVGQQVVFSLDLYSVLIIILVCVIITLLSGGYAAFYLSSYNPIQALRGGRQTKAKERSRKVLIGFQFFLSVAILLCTSIMYKQLHTMTNADTGVDKNNIVTIESNLWYGAQTFFDVLKNGNPNIVDATIASVAPYDAKWGNSEVYWDGAKDDLKSIEFAQVWCDHNYADVFGLQLLEGRFIPPRPNWRKPEETDEEKKNYIVINESFRKLIGKDPIGMTINYLGEIAGEVIGVVKDFNFKPLKEPTTPLIMAFEPEAMMHMFIKTTGNEPQGTLDFIKAKFDDMKQSDMPFISNYAINDYQKLFQREMEIAKIMLLFTIISFVLSLLGIFSMVAFSIEKRTKELAIRKINGATKVDIAQLFTSDIAKIGTIGAIIALPVCYVLMSRWLESYIFRTSLSWWIFAAVPLIIILLSALLVTLQVVITANRNPIESLSKE